MPFVVPDSRDERSRGESKRNAARQRSGITHRAGESEAHRLYRSAGFASGDVLLACLKRDVARVRLPASSSDDHTAAPEVSRLSVADYALPKRPARAVSRTPGGGALVVSGTRIVVFNADGVPSRVQVIPQRCFKFAPDKHHEQVDCPGRVALEWRFAC